VLRRTVVQLTRKCHSLYVMQFPTSNFSLFAVYFITPRARAQEPGTTSEDILQEEGGGVGIGQELNRKAEGAFCVIIPCARIRGVKNG
jgi:hypothetical protein